MEPTLCRWPVMLLTAALILGVSSPALARRQKPAPTTTTTTPTPTPPPTGPEGVLNFGAYPWGSVGAATSIAPSAPENPTLSMSSVKTLKGDKSFTVHLYADYDGASNASADALMSEASWWSSNGLKVAAVLRYRPATATATQSGYAAWVAAITQRLATLPNLADITVGNEPNNLSPEAGDGSYPNVLVAIPEGVITARDALDTAGRAPVRVGVNWAAGADPTVTEPMWSALERNGGSRFVSSVGFVGLNSYPGTWSSPFAADLPTRAQIELTLRQTLSALKQQHLPAAGLSSALPVVVGETGWPTTTTRAETIQNNVLAYITSFLIDNQATYNITDVRWFDLRDGNTDSGQLENGYGLLRSDYTPKAAFATYAQLIATYGK